MSSIGYVIVNLRFSHKKSSILYLYNCIVSSFCPDCKTNLFFYRGFFRRPVFRGRFPPNLRPQTGQNLCKSGISPVDMRRVGDDRGSPGRKPRQHQCRPAPQVGGLHHGAAQRPPGAMVSTLPAVSACAPRRQKPSAQPNRRSKITSSMLLSLLAQSMAAASGGAASVARAG